MSVQTVWNGAPPKKCDLCGKQIGETFVDGKTKQGPWGILCVFCHVKFGVGLGNGKGQEYRMAGNKWVKTAG